jgi:hypothetical protein
MMKMQAPEKIGYAMLKRMPLRAFVKKKTFIAPRSKPMAKIRNQTALCCLFEILLYTR